MRPAPMTRLQRITYRVWFAVGVVLLTGATFYLAYRPLAVVLAPILFALLIVYLLNPLVVWFERHRVPRLLGTALTYLLVAGVTVGLGLLVLPMLSAQVNEFAAEAPELGASFAEGVRAFGERFGLDLEFGAVVDAQVMAQQLQEFVVEAENRETVLALLGGLSGLARGALFVLLTLALGPVIAFYVLVDLPRFRAMTMRLLPPQHREEVATIGTELARVVGGFVRGQLVIASFVGIASSIALGAIGLRFWLVVGVVAGVTNLVPLLGPWVAGIVGVSVALLTDGFGLALLVALVMAAIQQFESSVLSPLILGRTVRLHPLIVLLAILVAGMLYGVFGMLVVVPLIAGAKVLAQHLWHTRVPWALPDPDQAEQAPGELVEAGAGGSVVAGGEADAAEPAEGGAAEPAGDGGAGPGEGGAAERAQPRAGPEREDAVTGSLRTGERPP